MNKRLLISKMKFFGDVYLDLARYLGLSLSRLTAKINETSGAEFNQGEIRKIREKYNLSNEDVIQIFFDEIAAHTRDFSHELAAKNVCYLKNK